MKPRFKSFALMTAILTLCAFCSETRAAFIVSANVLSSTANTHTVRFSFSGDMSGLTPRGFYDDSLFLNYNSSSALFNSLPTSINISSFQANTAARTDGGMLNLMETRESDAYFNRIRFGFNSDFVVSDVFAVNSFVDVVFPTVAPLTSSDFNGLPIYWGLGTDSVPSFTVAAPEPSIGMFLMFGLGTVIGFRKRVRLE